MDKISLIIPLYNAEQHIPGCLDRLLAERTGSFILEIILVDDGSTDQSGAVCQRYARCHSAVKYLRQPHMGVSAARNLGIRNAAGRYIFFLDADDRLAPGTIGRVAAFFDDVYDRTDLVTYPIETIWKGRKLKPHFRYRYLKESGVYDLREEPYIGQTTMNIAIKNQFAGNILFDENQAYSEDQKFCCDVLKAKLQMGFCRDGSYLYYRSRSSASGRLAGSCYIFEQCMGFFENLFSGYEEVPAAFQGLYVNDLYWKMCSNILFPYHYGKAEYQNALERMQALLGKCEPSVILNHPAIDFYEKYYLLRLMGGNVLQWRVNKRSFSLWDKGRLALQEKSMEMVITKVRIWGSQIEICGFLKTAFFQFYDREPTLCAVENGGRLTRKLKLFPSAHNYYQSREATQCFWAVRYLCDGDGVRQFHFEAEVGNYWFPIHYYFMPLTPFSHQYKRYIYRKDSVLLEIKEDNEFEISRLENVQARRQRRIWLYYDCRGVARDNGMMQFEHDIVWEDGVERYYVISDKRQALNPVVCSHGVWFGSRRHKRLFLKAEKLVTAYIEENNILPFPMADYGRYAGKFRFEVIYLQHGVLHIKMPWKYSPEKMMADKVVVSTRQEAELFQKNGFRDAQLWKVKMPRFDFLSPPAIRERKMLFAPSWRSYLVGDNVDNKWELLPENFKESAYYKKIQSFLASEPLAQMLEERQYTLEVKLHPIFSGYAEYFHAASQRICFVNQIREEEYALLITDFSSILYDFLYIKTPVLIFIPDVTEFKAGMNGYRRLDHSQQFMEQASAEPEEIVGRVKDFLDGRPIPEPCADFFQAGSSRKEIYLRMMRGK